MKRLGAVLLAVLSASLLLTACSRAARTRKTDATSTATRTTTAEPTTAIATTTEAESTAVATTTAEATATESSRSDAGTTTTAAPAPAPTAGRRIRFDDIEPVIRRQHLKANEPFFGEDDLAPAAAELAFADLAAAIRAARDYRSCRIFSRFALGICSPDEPDATQMLDLLLYSDAEGRRLLNDQVDSLNEGSEHLILFLSEDGIWHRQPDGSYRDLTGTDAGITPLGLWQLYEIIFAEDSWRIYLGDNAEADGDDDDSDDDDFDTVVLHSNELGDEAFALLFTAYTLTVEDLEQYERELTIAFRLEGDDDRLYLTAFDATLLLTHTENPARQVAISTYTQIDAYDDIRLPLRPEDLDDDIEYLDDFYRDELFDD
ncbi:MAG: hypothetical protein QM270_09065 [Bacillota bacterium]|nr:hypothetical protein [Bacillota bacterium]